MFYRSQPQPQIPLISELQEFKIMHTLGTGAFATVKLGTHLPSNRKVALKMYPRAEGLQKKAIEQEILCLKELAGCEGFPKLSEVHHSEGVVLVQEYVSGKSLFKVVMHK
jgi:serine/threonine protein kinase